MLAVPVAALIALLAVPAALAQTTVDENIAAQGAPPGGIVPEDPTVGHVAIVNELTATHKDLTGIMEAQSAGDYTTPDYPFVMTYVDEGARSS